MAMEMIEVKSSWVQRIGWEDGKLVVEAKSGSSYTHEGVPYKLYASFLLSRSKGKFYNKHIKGRYQLGEHSI
jgi:hypothetical protein